MSEKVDPFHPPLEGKEAKNAAEEKVKYYPEVVRSNRDEPVSQQSHGLLSFHILKESKKFKTPKGKEETIYGFVKLRGNWADRNQAISKASEIVRRQDSKFATHVVDVGVWLPITTADMAQTTVSIDLDQPINKAKEQAMQEREHEEARIKRELEESKKEFLTRPDYNEDENGIDFYTLKRTGLMFLRENIQKLEIQLKSLVNKRDEQALLIKELDAKHPNYRNEWVDNYNKERRKAGIPDFIPSSEDA